MEDWAQIRRLRRAEGVPIKAIARQLGISRGPAICRHGRPLRQQLPDLRLDRVHDRALGRPLYRGGASTAGACRTVLRRPAPAPPARVPSGRPVGDGQGRDARARVEKECFAVYPRSSAASHNVAGGASRANRSSDREIPAAPLMNPASSAQRIGSVPALIRVR